MCVRTTQRTTQRVQHNRIESKGAISVYINSGPTTTSTTTTTTHILDPKVDDALDKIAVLESELSTVTKVMELAKTTAFENQAAVETMGERLQVANGW